jgi:hypothetical protein
MPDAHAIALSGTDAFLHRVLIDGRFIREFHDRPMEVAPLLGISLTPVEAAKVATMSLEHLLQRLFETRFKVDSVGSRVDGTMQLMGPGTIVIVIVVAAIVCIVVITWTVTRDRARRPPKDNSSLANSKL